MEEPTTSIMNSISSNLTNTLSFDYHKMEITMGKEASAKFVSDNTLQFSKVHISNKLMKIEVNLLVSKEANA